MSTMRVSTSFRSLTTQALQNTRAVSADKIMALASNTGWLVEGYLDTPTPGNSVRANPILFDHTGNGSGATIPVTTNLMRGLYRSVSDFSLPIVLTGDDHEQAVCSILPDFHYGTGLLENCGWNWRCSSIVPFIPHRYALSLRTRVQIRRSAGTETATITPVVYDTSAALNTIGRGASIPVTSSSFITVELAVNLDEDVPYSRTTTPVSPWYWGVLAWIPSGTSIEIQDDDNTGPCLALSSRC